MMERTGVIIVAGGSGTRMGGNVPKQFRLLHGMPILARSINLFAKALPGVQIVVVLPEQHIEFWKNLAARFIVSAHTTVAGGAQRFHSVQKGLAAIASDVEWIAVHDAVRPLASVELIRAVAAAAAEHDAALPVVKPADTVRSIDSEGSHLIDREALRLVQTPQIFRAELLRRAYEAPYAQSFTDDASVVEAAGASVALCEGEPTNLKITTPGDFALAEALLAAREAAAETEDDDDEHL